jgi:purine-nucleoside phosphorylase
MLQEIRETVAYLTARIRSVPKVGMVTGTGLGRLTENMDVELRLSYEDIPHFPRSTIVGHKGALVFGRVAGVPMVAMEGRFHLYEGYTFQEVTFPVRVMSELGVRFLFISSAAGGLNPHFEPADLMVVTDHINFTGGNPLVGGHLEDSGPRFPDMSQVYDRELIQLAGQKALEEKVLLRSGVYVAVLGPSLETPAETRFLRMIGADAVGMSTVPEAIVGVQCGLRIMAIVAITNINLPDCMNKTTVEEVIATAQKASPNLAVLWKRVIAEIPQC